jgi:hypothetical protein
MEGLQRALQQETRYGQNETGPGLAKLTGYILMEGRGWLLGSVCLLFCTPSRFTISSASDLPLHT